ncbi:MAG: gas vesicle protein GvpJ [Solirubrobacteraceae bacterium]
MALIDLLDRLLQGGVVIQGDVTLAAADVDLVKLDLRILLAAIDKTLGP